MRTFHCDHCNSPLYFENSVCTSCGHELGLLPGYLRVSALKPLDGALFRPLMPAARHLQYRKCKNYSQHNVCNWMVREDDEHEYCLACRLNEVIPNLSRDGYYDRWYRLERAKRRLVYSLMKLGLPVHPRPDDKTHGLGFAFMSDLDTPDNKPVVTGHRNGLITISIDEADSVLREKNRLTLKEKYRTLLGHFRHETGHYYWDTLIRDQPVINDFRSLFGDERTDYGKSLQRYYKNGPPADWNSHFITRYASSHPWEDWAESWAHYLHIVDTLETAGHFGLQMERELETGGLQIVKPHLDAYQVNAYRVDDFDSIIEHWIPLTHALNSLNRSMGLRDLYPFVLSDEAIRKLGFIHQLIHAQQDFPTDYVELEEKSSIGAMLLDLFRVGGREILRQLRLRR